MALALRPHGEHFAAVVHRQRERVSRRAARGAGGDVAAEVARVEALHVHAQARVRACRLWGGWHGGEREVAQVAGGERGRRGGVFERLQRGERLAGGSLDHQPVRRLARRGARDRDLAVGRGGGEQRAARRDRLPGGGARRGGGERFVACAERGHARAFASGAVRGVAPHDRAGAGCVAGAVAGEHDLRGGAGWAGVEDGWRRPRGAGLLRGRHVGAQRRDRGLAREPRGERERAGAGEQGGDAQHARGAARAGERGCESRQAVWRAADGSCGVQDASAERRKLTVRSHDVWASSAL